MRVSISISVSIGVSIRADLRSGGHPPNQKKENKIASKFSEVKKKTPAGRERSGGQPAPHAPQAIFSKNVLAFFTF
jgi:hypothetical protein